MQLHVGSRIAPAGQEGFGIVSLVVGEGGAPTHALTAGHLFPPGVGHVAEGLDGEGRWPLGTVVANGLDQATPRDVALLQLTADAAAAWQPQLGPVVTDLGDAAARVRVWTPRAAPSTAFRARPTVRVGVFEAPARPAPFTLRDLLVVYPGRTRPGDSGALLLDGDRAERAVGLLVGTLHAGSFYEPLARALRTVRSLTAAPLQPLGLAQGPPSTCSGSPPTPAPPSEQSGGEVLSSSASGPRYKQ